MFLIKISPDHFIIADDSEIKNGDYCIHLVTHNVTQQHNKSCYGNWKKITHSTHSIEGVFPLNLSEVKELISEVDVEKKSEDYTEEWSGKRRIDTYIHNAYIAGYNQCLKDNKEKIYTKEDLEKAYNFGMHIEAGNIQFNYKKYNSQFEQFMDSIQPKTQWEVMFDENNKLKLK